MKDATTMQAATDAMRNRSRKAAAAKRTPASVDKPRTSRAAAELRKAPVDGTNISALRREELPVAKKAMGGKVMTYAKGGSIDGVAIKGKTKCKIC